MFGFRKIKILIFLLLLAPSIISAKEICSKDGYTVLTMNGIFNSEARAIKNKDQLQRNFPSSFNGQPLKFDFVHNPSHLAGLGDVLKAAYQGLLDDETIQDYDLTQILVTASNKIKTQKVLIVAHSQGNFYANSFYDVVAGQEGGIPKESIGVYAVATPSGRTSGNGLWLTSSTDKVIAGTVAGTLRRKIMPPNTTIDLSNEPGSNGHGFTEVYLKYRAERMVSDIEKSLAFLQNNSAQAENEPCMDSPKISLSHKVTGILFAVADPVANTSSNLVSSAYGMSNKLLESGSVLVERSLTKTSNFVFKSGRLLANGFSSFFNTKKGEMIASNSSEKETIDTEEKNTNLVKTTVKIINQKQEVKEDTNEEILKTEKSEEKYMKTEEEKNKIPDTIEIVPIIPKQGSGGGVKNPNSQNNSSLGTLDNVVNFSVSIPTCSMSVSINTCLLAQTEISVSWPSVPTAEHYIFSVNGVISTTTATSITLELEDFTDYTLEVVPVHGGGASPVATSTKVFTIATIPIAINEIAFWGTISDENDEWLELKNNTNHSIDLSKWLLKINNGEATLPLSGTLDPKSYLLITHGNSALVLQNEKNILSWSEDIQNIFNDTGEKILLFYGENNLDSTPNWNDEDGTGVYDFGDKTSIERKKSRLSGDNFSNWGYNLEFIKNGKDADNIEVLATPGEHNSVSYLINDGENLISQNITLDAENGPYAVFDNMRVLASSTLTIDPGTTLYFITDNFGNNGSFLVNGRVVVGGEGDPVEIKSFNNNIAGDFWIDSNKATSTFTNVVFENTETIGLVNNSKVEITDSSFIDNGSGIGAYDGATLVLENVNIATTTGEAVAAYDANVSISSSTITNVFDADGISAYSNSIININNVTVENVEYDGIAIYNSTAYISSTTVNSTGNNGLAHYNSTTTINNMTVSDTDDSGILIINGRAEADNLNISDFNSGYAIEIIVDDNFLGPEVSINDSVIVGQESDIESSGTGSVTLENLNFCAYSNCLAN